MAGIGFKTRADVYCSRCNGVFHTPDQLGRARCPFCGFAHTVSILTSGPSGTQRTADSTGDATAATGITVS